MVASLAWFWPWLWPLILFGAADAYSCELSRDWMGHWFHSGFNEPLVISNDGISKKGRCVQRSKNMFLMEESDPDYKCYRCMVIYEKHVNVLQYKESYCEEKTGFDSMASLCNTIAGDAPLFTMFRKDGELVKCPFRGPHSFSYSKGDSGQVCKYPASFMDTCSDNQRLKLRYQACLDVEGSEIATEEMACLGTWKEGSSRYLVSMLNHSHVYTDEARYRCFVFQRQHSNEPGSSVTYKMAQSLFASCLGLWNVNEGHKTFTMTKLDSDKEKCTFPHFMHNHHDWHSVDGLISLHVNKRGHSMRLRNHTRLASIYDDGYLESHATCHKVEAGGGQRSKMTRIVVHVKAGCDSGYVCLVFTHQDKHVIEMRYGDKSINPKEACMNYYFDPINSPIVTLVSEGHNTRPCPFSGRYTLTASSAAVIGGPLGSSMTALIGGQLNCQRAVMHAGCLSASDDLIVESVCSRNLEDNVRTQWSCHGQWTSKTRRQMLVLSTPNRVGGTGVSGVKGAPNYVCLSYTEREGILSASASSNSCQFDDGGVLTDSGQFNITSSGPCLQALTGKGMPTSTPVHWPLMTSSVLAILLLRSLM